MTNGFARSTAAPTISTSFTRSSSNECAGAPPAEWRERLDHFDVPNGVVTDLEGLLADRYLAETSFFEPVEHPSEGKMLTMPVPVAFSATPGESFRLPPPRLGEHKSEVLAELGYPDVEIDRINA